MPGQTRRVQTNTSASLPPGNGSSLRSPPLKHSYVGGLIVGRRVSIGNTVRVPTGNDHAFDPSRKKVPNLTGSYGPFETFGFARRTLRISGRISESKTRSRSRGAQTAQFTLGPRLRMLNQAGKVGCNVLEGFVCHQIHGFEVQDRPPGRKRAAVTVQAQCPTLQLCRGRCVGSLWSPIYLVRFCLGLIVLSGHPRARIASRVPVVKTVVGRHDQDWHPGTWKKRRVMPLAHTRAAEATIETCKYHRQSDHFHLRC